MGCLKTIPVPAFFPPLPFLCHSRAGGPPWGRSLPLLGYPSPYSSELPRERCMSPVPAILAHSLWTSACCQGCSHGPPLALTAGAGFSFWKPRGEVLIPNLHRHSGPTESSLSQAVPTLHAGTFPGVLAQCSGKCYSLVGQWLPRTDAVNLPSFSFSKSQASLFPAAAVCPVG